MANTTKRKKANLKMFFALIINIVLLASTGLFIYYLLKLNGIEDVSRIIFSVAFPLLVLMIVITTFKAAKKNKKIKYAFLIVLSALLIGVNSFGYYSINKVLSTFKSVSKGEEVVSISLVALKSSNLKITDIKAEDKIAAISSEVSASSMEVIDDFKKANGLKNEIVPYDSYLDIADALYKGTVKYAFLPTDFSSIFASSDDFSDIADKIVSLKEYSKTKKQEETVQKKVTEPFTILFMGVDTLTSSYNADTLLVVTFNPNTLSATMLSIPRDTYTTISCSGRKHKINSSGWSGDKCVVKTVSNYIDVNIDYYVKVNFTGVVDLVNLLGGVDVDVPYTFCEQDSKRRFGSHMIYVEHGQQTLNGEQALALTRNRHYWGGKCDKKYTTEGNRSDFTRGQNQQLVLKAMLNKMKSIDNISTVYKILDSLGNNMVTNMSTDTMLSLYNVGKDILVKTNGTDRDISKIVNIQKLKFTSTTKTIKIGNLNLSTVINYDESVQRVSEAMKVNLGLKEPAVVKTFEFDVNNSYEETIIGTKLYGGGAGSDIVLLPDFVGKDISYVESWAQSNGLLLKTEYKEVSGDQYKDGEVIEQSIKPKTDISTIKTLSLVVASVKKTVEKTPTQFSYNQCLNKEESTNEQCMIKNYVGFDISVFRNWVAQTGLSLPIEYQTVNGTSGKIVGQNISGISIYELINQNKTLEITYAEAKETNNDNNNDDNNNGNNNNEDNHGGEENNENNG